MVVDDLEFMNILRGKRIKLTLKTSSYLGVLQRVNPNKSLVLVDVVSGSNGCKFPGSKVFFGHEILNVEFTNDANTNRGNIVEPKEEDHLNVKKFQPYKNKIMLDYDDEDEEYINFVVIDEFHEKFGPAVMHIKKQHVVGVGAEGVEVYKNGRLCWLQIATKNKVYLFDILLLGARAFKNGLSMILENKHVLKRLDFFIVYSGGGSKRIKVIHDCRAIAGCLSSQFGVKLSNVFDTQVADVLCFYSETGGFLPDRVSTLQEVVNFRLKVPSSQLLSLQMKSQLTKEETAMWCKRPCPIPLLKVMALSVIHLQPLRLVLLDTLMTDYMALVDSYLNSGCYALDDLEHACMGSVLELPSELRQLEQMRSERQERASKRYPVTEQGLLARFNPKNPSPSKTSSSAQEHNHMQPDCSAPSTVEAPSSTHSDPHQSPTSPSRVAEFSSSQSVDMHASPDLTVQNQVPTTLTDRKEISFSSSLSLGLGRGRSEVLMEMMGRGRPFGMERSSTPPLPLVGRGCLLQIPPTQIPRSPGDSKPPGAMEVISDPMPSQEGTAQSASAATDPLSNTVGLADGSFSQSSRSSLWQSFRSFKY